MVYSKFGSALALISKKQDADGRLVIYATAAGGADVREYRIEELKADGGSAEIDLATKALPLKEAAKKVERESRGLY